MYPAERRLTGRVVAVRGTVVEAHFDDGVPPLDAALECGWDHDRAMTAVVHSHVGDSKATRSSIFGKWSNVRFGGISSISLSSA